MAWIRTVKPEYFTHPEIVSLSVKARYLFLAMLTQADDAGRMYDQPLKIHALSFGEDDDHATPALLTELEKAGHIARYSVEGKRCIQIVNFSKHQVVRKERAARSSIPAGHNVDGESGPTDGQTRPPDAENMQEQGTGNREQGTGNGEKDSPDGFEDFWQAYPTRNGKRVEKGKAHSSWKRLNNPERESARRGVAHYRKACDEGLTIAKDAFRWLRDRAFDDWQTPAEAPKKPGEPSAHYHKPFDVETDVPSCEHSTPICLDCRRKAKDAIRAIGATIGEAS